MSWISVKRFFMFFILGFILLFGLRLAYGFHTTPAAPQKRSTREYMQNSDRINFSEDPSKLKRNYASAKVARRMPLSSPLTAAPVDQKYEKTATVLSATSNLESDDLQVRQKIEKYRGVVQFEQSSGGGENAASIQLIIGVHPDSFDAFCKEVQNVGALVSFNVTKTDKTNEFLNLQAKRASLEANRTALSDLKNHDGRVDEFINLQYRILELDQQLQALGVQLGDYDEINEFCSVRLTLFEIKEWWEYPPSLPRRMMTAFTWTIRYYAAFVSIMAGCLFAAFLLVLIINKLAQWGNFLASAERKDR